MIVGLFFLAGSLIPGILPRPWQVQGVVSGLALAIGYGIGSTTAGVWHRFRREVQIRKWPTIAALVASTALVIWSLIIHALWRADVAVLMDTELPLLPYLPRVLVTAFVAGLFLILLGRGLHAVFRSYRRLLSRMVPGWLAVLVTLLTAGVAAVLFFDLVLLSRVVPAVEEAHRTSDRRFEPGITPPNSEALAGGPKSLIDWATMGSQGRAFVAQTPTTTELAAFSGNRPLEPVRIYVGLETAHDAEARAALAVDEMERAGAFDRQVIVLIAPTGSGWIDPYAIDGIEYMYNGDTAAVAVQYSYLASWMVMIGNQDLASDAARALLSEVLERLDQEPDGDRPMLLLYGESLGAFGWERLFEDLGDVIDTVDGALWVGPPRSGKLWQSLVARRDAGSPVWQPVYREGQTVRFGADGEALASPDSRWDPPRVVYLQHPSDPITWWTPELLLKRPEWLDPPLGTDISHHMPYLPVVTFWHIAVDLAVGTNAPPGHGHKFGTAQPEAWSLIAPPAGWTTADTERLVAVFDE
ncbi:MAG TPA: alpha/beta-hydrolase family protein [Acidimicrobiia bacterium]|nr:alpha/beta-hydrolase family protein [Acidimicrobiia bacterium]